MYRLGGIMVQVISGACVIRRYSSSALPPSQSAQADRFGMVLCPEGTVEYLYCFARHLLGLSPFVDKLQCTFGAQVIRVKVIQCFDDGMRRGSK